MQHRRFIFTLHFIAVFFVTNLVAAEIRYSGNHMSCMQNEAEQVVSPKITTQKDYYIFDSDGDNVLSAAEINYTIRIASKESSKGEYFSRILIDPNIALSNQNMRLWLDGTINIGSWVIFDGRNYELEENYELVFWKEQGNESKYVVHFLSNTINSGIVNTTIQTGNTFSAKRVTDSVIRVDASSNWIYVMNNEIYDELDSAYGNHKGAGAGTHGMKIGPSSNVFVYGNYVSGAATGISHTGRQSNRIEVTGNTINNWRERAIYVNANGVDGVSDILISYNLINPPKQSKVSRQPIAFQAAELYYNTRNAKVYWNTINNVQGSHSDNVISQFTADNISLHRVNEFNIWGNCVYNAGELGINASENSRNGIIAFNYVFQSDLSGINVQRNPTKPDDYTDLIMIRNNIVDRPGLDTSQDYADRIDPPIAAIYNQCVTNVTIHSSNMLINLGGVKDIHPLDVSACLGQ